MGKPSSPSFAPAPKDVTANTHMLVFSGQPWPDAHSTFPDTPSLQKPPTLVALPSKPRHNGFGGAVLSCPATPCPPLLSQHLAGMLLCQGQGEHTRLQSCSKVCPCHHGRQARSRGRKSFARQEKPGLPHMPRRVFPKDLPSLKAEAVQVATKPEAGT